MITFRDRVRVSPIVEKIMMKFRFRWFGHVWRRLVDTVVRRVDKKKGIPVTRGWGRPRKTTCKTIMKDLGRMIYDRTLWHCLIHVAYPHSGIWLCAYDLNLFQQ